jgi:serine/threonine protein kinase
MAFRRRRNDSSSTLFPGFGDVSEIGAGSLATVYRAREHDTGRWVALKLLNIRDASPRALESFQRESVALGALSSHPNIVTLYRSFPSADSRPVLVLELCAGSVADQAHAGGMPVAEAMSIGIKVAGALETAHRAEILHRDVKPQNILLTEFGEPALADFGVAMLQASAQTTAGLFDFTTLHAAPELLEGGATSPATDVYELASTLYQLIAGQSAFRSFDGESPASVILRILRDPVQPLIAADVPMQLSDLLVAAMSKEKEQRPPTAAEFADALGRIEISQGWPRTQFLVRDQVARPDGGVPAVVRRMPATQPTAPPGWDSGAGLTRIIEPSPPPRHRFESAPVEPQPARPAPVPVLPIQPSAAQPRPAQPAPVPSAPAPWAAPAPAVTPAPDPTPRWNSAPPQPAQAPIEPAIETQSPDSWSTQDFWRTEESQRSDARWPGSESTIDESIAARWERSIRPESATASYPVAPTWQPDQPAEPPIQTPFVGDWIAARQQIPTRSDPPAREERPQQRPMPKRLVMRSAPSRAAGSSPIYVGVFVAVALVLIAAAVVAAVVIDNPVIRTSAGVAVIAVVWVTYASTWPRLVVTRRDLFCRGRRHPPQLHWSEVQGFEARSISRPGARRPLEVLVAHTSHGEQLLSGTAASPAKMRRTMASVEAYRQVGRH